MSLLKGLGKKCSCGITREEIPLSDSGKTVAEERVLTLPGCHIQRLTFL